MLRRILLACLAWALAASTAAAQPAFLVSAKSGTGGPTTGVDTTGATLIVISVATDGSAPNPTVSDSPGYTYTALTSYGGASPPWNRTRVYYATNPTTNASHTFTVLGTNRAFVAAAFSGVVTTSPFDVEAGAGFTTGTSAQGGSVTPSQASSLVISAMGHDGARTFSIDSSFTIIDAQAFSSGINYGAAIAYRVLSSSSAQNPSWSWTTNTSGAVANAVFKGTGGGGGGSRRVIVVPE